VKVPDPETVAALHDSRNGAVTRFTSVDDLFADTDDRGIDRPAADFT